jgi:DNA-binding XRE family transcriptional regulator
VIPALAFCDFDAVRQLPPLKRYVASFLDLATHIRQRRIDLRLSQDDLAELFGVTKDTIVYWETQQIAPDITKFPMILAFLGYNPLAGETDTLAGKLKQYRYVHGLSQRKLARQLGVSFTALKSWEENEFTPNPEHHKRLDELLGI